MSDPYRDNVRNDVVPAKVNRDTTKWREYAAAALSCAAEAMFHPVFVAKATQEATPEEREAFAKHLAAIGVTPALITSEQFDVKVERPDAMKIARMCAELADAMVAVEREEPTR